MNLVNDWLLGFVFFVFLGCLQVVCVIEGFQLFWVVDYQVGDYCVVDEGFGEYDQLQVIGEVFQLGWYWEKVVDLDYVKVEQQDYYCGEGCWEEIVVEDVDEQVVWLVFFYE